MLTPTILATRRWASGQSGLSPSLVLFTTLAIALTGCGYIGDPLPPSLDIPTRITDLRALEYGANIVAQFTLPPLTTEGLPLKNVASVDLYIGVVPVPYTAAAWMANARHIVVPAKGPGALTHQIPAREWIGKDLFLQVRATGPKGKVSPLSNQVPLHVDAPLPLPTGFEARNAAKGVQLAWKSTGPHYRVFRATGDQPPEKLTDTDNPTWLDETTHYGTAYRYYVQAFAGELTQSELTDPANITPKDEFPPAVPAGLTAVAATASIELAWERNTETDFRGYNVYRSVDGAPFVKIAPLIDAPAYGDRAIEAGKKYRYTVSSVDLLGNESERSAIAEATAQ